MNNKFDFSTIKDFDNHISASINGYELLDSLVFNIASFFCKNTETVSDLGCTSGRLISKIADAYNCKCFGFDLTDNNFLQTTKATLVKQDITAPDFEIPVSNLILSVFTLQFIAYEHRLKVLKKIYASLKKNGALIICEKEIAGNGAIQEVFTFSNYDYKKRNFSEAEILKKESDLRHIMNPLSSGENLALLKSAGFKVVECFFQSLNFKGWLCLK
jgi:tRNA (cmo5U34)-methyltransferase